MARCEPYSDAEDPRFARYDRSGRYDDHRYSGAGSARSAGTRGRTGHYDGYSERPSPDSLASHGRRPDYSDRQPRSGRQARTDRQPHAEADDYAHDHDHDHQYDRGDWPRRSRTQPGTSSVRTSRNGAQAQIPPSGSEPSVAQTGSYPRTAHARTPHTRTSQSGAPPARQSGPRPASSHDLYDLPRFGRDYERDVDTAGRPRFVPYDDGGRSAPPPPKPSGRSPWLVFAAACVVAVVVLVLAAMSRGRDDAGSPAADLSSAQMTVPSPTSTAAGTPQAQYDQEAPIMQDGVQVGVMTVGRPEGVDSFYAGTYTPEHGPLFATFKVTMRNTSTGPIEYNMFEFYVRSAAADRLDPTIGRDPAFETGSLDPGETTSGWITFDAGDHGTLVYSPGAFGTIVTEWSF